MQERIGKRNHNSSVMKDSYRKTPFHFQRKKRFLKNLFSFIFSPLVNVTGPLQTLSRYSLEEWSVRDICSIMRWQCQFPCLTGSNAAQNNKTTFLITCERRNIFGAPRTSKRTEEGTVNNLMSVLWELPLMKSPARSGPGWVTFYSLSVTAVDSRLKLHRIDSNWCNHIIILHWKTFFL